MKKKSGRNQEQSENLKIAVIEEIADDIYSIKFILQSIGYDVESFSSQESYQEALVEFAPQLVIIDMMISDGQAYQVMKELGQSRLKKVPILAITAEAMEGEEQDVYQAGGQDVLSKPYEVSDLRKKIKKWIK
jgi:CheY-like chemotaxis protein